MSPQARRRIDPATGIAHPSTSQGPLQAGSYGFKATYSGDGNFNGSTGTCEPLTVNKAQLTAATTIHNASHSAIPINTHMHSGLGSARHRTVDRAS